MVAVKYSTWYNIKDLRWPISQYPLAFRNTGFRSNSNWKQKTFVRNYRSVGFHFQNEFSFLYSRIYFHFHFHHCFYYCLFIYFFISFNSHIVFNRVNAVDNFTRHVQPFSELSSCVFLIKIYPKVFILCTVYVRFNLCNNIQQDIPIYYVYIL